MLLKPLVVHGDVLESEQLGYNRNVMPVEKTGTYGGYGLLNQGKQPTLNSLAKNYGGSESNAFFKPMMSKDTLNNQFGGSQLGSVSEHQTFNQIGSKEVSQSFNKNKVVQKSEVGDVLRSNIKEKNWVREPASIQDQMALEAAKRGEGDVVMTGLTDPKFLGMDKMRLKCKSDLGKDSVLHYVRDPKTGELMDFKFKKRSTD